MKTLYSILSISLNQALGERISVGLLLFSPNKKLFRFSSEKFKLIKPFLNSREYDFLKLYLPGMEEEIENNSDEFIAVSNWVNENYISYLGDYAQNNVHFSKPKEILVELNQHNFNKLFQKYVYSKEEEVSKTPSHLELHLKTWQHQFYSNIKNYVSLDIHLSQEEIPGLVVPITVNLLGKNEVPVAGQIINFSSRADMVERNLANYISLNRALINKPGTFFVIGDEPPKDLLKNHILWDNVRKTDFLKYVSIEESEYVESYLEKHQVKPFLPKEVNSEKSEPGINIH